MLAKRIIAAILGLIVIWCVGYVLEANVIEYVVRVILLCGIYAILAVGLNLINGTTGQFSIGHAGFMAVGAYMTAFTVIHIENAFHGQLAALPPFLAHGLVLIAGLVVGAVLAGFTGLLVGAPSLRLRGDYLAIVTLGFGEIIRLIFNNAESFGGATGYSGGRPLGLPTYSNFFWVFTVAAVVIALISNLTFSRFGRALSAIREDEISAEAMGIPTTKLKVTAFVISAMVAGIGGGLFAHLQSSIAPTDFKMDRSIDMIVMIILGGLGSITGAVVGAIFVAVSLELMRDFQQYRLVAYALLLIFVMLVRPQGLLGRYELNISKLLQKWTKTKEASS